MDPCKEAVKRVTDRLEIPCICNNCGGLVEVAHHCAIYGHKLGNWPWVYACNDCDSYVGMHPRTNLPLGTLANKELRALRIRAKNAFNYAWQMQGMNRTDGYTWLASKLGIKKSKCHIGWSDEAQCKQIIEICEGL